MPLSNLRQKSVSLQLGPCRAERRSLGCPSGGAASQQHTGAQRRQLGTAATLFFIGILIFSGSLYILALSGVKAWGAVTPLGGLTLLAAWLWLTRGALETASGTRVGREPSAKDTRARERETL